MKTDKTPAKLTTLDVREDIREGRNVFGRIMDAVGRMTDGDTLRIIAPFEPHPLISVLRDRGFSAVVSELPEGGGCEVLFTAPISAEEDEALL